MPKTKVFLITGFLGAGKTTLLQNLLDALAKQGKKACVIVNEFGKINIDTAIVRRDGFEFVEINNGSIFCKCLEGTFVENVVKFAGQGFDYLLVESSGLSDPVNMNSIMMNANRLTQDAFSYEGIICILDAKNFFKVYRSLDTIRRQISVSNIIIINKIDLADEDTVIRIEQEAATLNPLAAIYKTTYGKVDDKLLETGGLPVLNQDESSNTPFNRPKVLLIKVMGMMQKEQIIDLFEALKDKLLRVKGFILTAEGVLHLDAVAEDIRFETSALDKKSSVMVLIPYPDLDIKKDAVEKLEQMKLNYQIF